LASGISGGGGRHRKPRTHHSPRRRSELGFSAVVAQVLSPAPIGFTVRRGARFTLATGISGPVLLAYRKPVEFALWKNVIGEKIRWAQARAGSTPTARTNKCHPIFHQGLGSNPNGRTNKFKNLK
jgi:hypothetical protein